MGQIYTHSQVCICVLLLCYTRLTHKGQLTLQAKSVTAPPLDADAHAQVLLVLTLHAQRQPYHSRHTQVHRQVQLPRTLHAQR